jgi:hypothetical protein
MQAAQVLSFGFSIVACMIVCHCPHDMLSLPCSQKEKRRKKQ